MDTSIKVLIVDDHKMMLRIIRNLLQQIGFVDVEEAVNGQEALQKLDAEKFGMIISDWNMDSMSGLDLLKAVRAAPDAALNSVPFIMITGEAKTENVVEAKKAGVSNYIIKPFTAETLKARIESVLK